MPSSLWNDEIGANVPEASITERTILARGAKITAGFMHINFMMRSLVFVEIQTSSGT